MTNVKQARNNGKRGGNRKDGGHFNRRLNQNKEFYALGFTRNDWNKWNYTWSGEFPIFLLSPGTIVTDGGPKSGLIAHYEPAGKEIYFPYGSSPADIAARLDNEIFAIMRHDAEIDDAPLDIDAFMAVV